MAQKNRLKGSLLIAMSALFFSSYGIWSRLMAGTFGEFNQAYIRAIVVLLVLIPLGLATKQFRKIEKKDWKWFIVIALAGGLNQAPYYYGFEHLNIGTAVLLFYTMLTLGAYVFGKFFFNEKMSGVKYLSLVLAIVGMVMIYSFSLSGKEIGAAMLVSMAGLMGATVVVMSKKLTDRYSEMQILTGVFVMMLLANFGISSMVGESLGQVGLVPALAQLGYSGAMLVANISVMSGFKYLDPSVGALIGLLEVIFGTIIGIVLFGEVMTGMTIVGSGVILIAIALPDVVEVVGKRK